MADFHRTAKLRRNVPSPRRLLKWRVVAPFMPSPVKVGRPWAWPMRLVFNGVLYVLRTGCAWAHLPHGCQSARDWGSSATSVQAVEAEWGREHIE